MKKLWPALWMSVLAALTLSALLAMTFNVWPGVQVRNNVLHLLPALRDDAVLRDALERSNQSVSRKLVLLVGDADENLTNHAAEWVEASVRRQSFFSDPVTGISAEQLMKTGRYYFAWRHLLLADSQRQWLANGNQPALENQLTQILYSPVSGVNADVLAGDPLLTFYSFMREMPAAQGNIRNVNGKLIVHAADRDYRVLLVDIRQDVFDMAFHPQYLQWRDGLQADINTRYPETKLLLMGSVQHAVWGASSAKREVSTIGNGSLLGIIVLILLIFSGWRALYAALLPLGAGVIAGLAATLLCYQEIHLITLVFGSSVIGVAMDYSLHYMAEHYKNSQSVGAQQCLKKILPGISFAMMTSVIAYASIGFAPFPVLRQIAVFSCSGLFMAWLTVVCLYPHILPPVSFRSLRFLHASDSLDKRLRHLFDKRGSRIALCILAVAMLPGIWNIHADDDLRLLQTPEPGIAEMEKHVQALTGIHPSSRFMLIEGKTQQQLLQRSEMLDAWLLQRNQQHTVDLLSRYMPSVQRQMENYQWLRALYINEDNINEDSSNQNNSTDTFAWRWQQQLGLPAAVITQAADVFSALPKSYLLPDTAALNGDNIRPMLERFQMTATTRGFIAAASVSVAADMPAIKQYASEHEGLHWMDPVADISAIFRHYREQTGWMMLVSYAIITALLCWRYGLAGAMRVLMAPALAAWMTLGVLGYAGVAINLFHVLALLLVLGVGIDYSIFFAESDAHRDTTMLAVVLSTITTLLSFGLLALSQTAAISSFGVVVSIGIVCSLLFSPLAQKNAA
jgi:predicted exporter